MPISQLNSGEKTAKRELNGMGKKAMVLDWGARTVQDWQDKAICKDNVPIYLLG